MLYLLPAYLETESLAVSINAICTLILKVHRTSSLPLAVFTSRQHNS